MPKGKEAREHYYLIFRNQRRREAWRAEERRIGQDGLKKIAVVALHSLSVSLVSVHTHSRGPPEAFRDTAASSHSLSLAIIRADTYNCSDLEGDRVSSWKYIVAHDGQSHKSVDTP